MQKIYNTITLKEKDRQFALGCFDTIIENIQQQDGTQNPEKTILFYESEDNTNEKTA